MTGGKKVVVDRHSRRTDVAGHAGGGTAQWRAGIIHSGLLLLMGRELAPIWLMVLGEPVAGRAVAALAPDAVAQGKARVDLRLFPAWPDVAVQTERGFVRRQRELE